MGGNALKNTFTRRYEKTEFDNLSEVLIKKIQDVFHTKVSLVKSYTKKDTFGDMDILILLPEDSEGKRKMSKIIELIQENFSPKEIISNGSCVSFDQDELQIDLIKVPHKNWQVANIFYAYNDLGNLMGKIYHKFNLKYGFDGLIYVYRKGDKILSKIVISKDPRKIFDFLGLDFDRCLNGFGTMKDVFDYVIGSKYFNADSFKFENLNSINKRRNKRRPNFKHFVEYTKEFQGGYEFLDKNDYLIMIDEFFPEANLFSKMKKADEKFKIENYQKEVFNGQIVMQHYPELKGPELGKQITKFKRYIGKDQPFDEYIQEMIDAGTTKYIMRDFGLSMLRFVKI